MDEREQNITPEKALGEAANIALEKRAIELINDPKYTHEAYEITQKRDYLDKLKVDARESLKEMEYILFDDSDKEDKKRDHRFRAKVAAVYSENFFPLLRNKNFKKSGIFIDAISNYLHYIDIENDPSETKTIREDSPKLEALLREIINQHIINLNKLFGEKTQTNLNFIRNVYRNIFYGESPKYKAELVKRIADKFDPEINPNGFSSSGRSFEKDLINEIITRCIMEIKNETLS